MTLLEPKRHAVLISSARYEDPEITDYPTITNSAVRLKELFDGSELWHSCRLVCDPAHAFEVMMPLRTCAVDCQPGDTLLVYYIGHAINPLRLQHSDILLALRSTIVGEHWSYLSLYHVYDTMRRSPATSKVLILDCCYCGQAEALGPGGAAPMPEPGWLVDQASSCVLKAVARGSVHQIADPFLNQDTASRYTALSGHLISILEHGIEGMRNPLQVRDVYNELRRVVVASGRHPEPELLIRNEPWIVLMENRHPGALVGPAADPSQLARLRAAAPEDLADAWTGDAPSLAGLHRALIDEYFVGLVPQADGATLRRIAHRLHETGAGERLDELVPLLSAAAPARTGAAVRELRRHECHRCAAFATRIHASAVQTLTGMPLHEYAKAAAGD